MVAITPQAALVDYLALGHARSLRTLRRHYTESGTAGPPSFALIGRWSKRYGWAAAAAEHDEKLGIALRSRLEEAAISRAFDRVEALLRSAQSCLDEALQIRVSAHGASAQDKRTLIEAAISAIKMAEVLSGGVSERREERSESIAAEALAALQALAAAKRAQALPAPAVVASDRP
jgi:hypothetical protein